MPGPIRSLLLGTEVKPAGRSCNCARDQNHRIQKGEPRVIVKNPGTPGAKGYCAPCGRAMLQLARQRLDELEQAFTE
jgi:hypothetical protein